MVAIPASTAAIALIWLALFNGSATSGQANRFTTADRVLAVIDATRPLAAPRGRRLPLYVWQANGIAPVDDAQAEHMIRALDARGIALLAQWNPARNVRDATLAEALRIARIQKRLGLPVSVDANRCYYGFCDGSPETAHLDEKGGKYFDLSFAPNRKMGCPFALEGKWPVVRAQFDFFARAYKNEGITVDMIAGDWEIDGPIEWNGAWAGSKRCARCRMRIPGIDDFAVFQAALKEERARIQREVFVKTLQSYFSEAHIGNYAEYPCDGYRYWYDWFEVLPAGAPFVADGKARHRPWPDLFTRTGYTMGMPVVYTWFKIWSEHDFADPDYRWIQNMLKVASNAAKSRDQKTPGLPLYSFVHWTTTANPSAVVPADLQALSERGYRELLWHMLLRGTDTFIMWCRADVEEIKKESRPVHEVWSSSLAYSEFLEKGEAVTFQVPDEPADVVSALVLGERALVRRSHFGSRSPEPAEILFKDRRIAIPAFTDECRVLVIE